MVRQKVQKSSERSSQSQESAMAPILTQRHSPSPHAQQDTESQAIQQHNREATVLKIQAKYGTITPEGQERLTFLQAKMADDTQRKLDVGDRTHQNISNSSGDDSSDTAPERNTAQPIQAKLTIGQPGDKYEKEADRVAAQVVNQIHAPTTQREALPETEDKLQMKPEIGSIQRQTMPEDEELQMMSNGAGMTAPQDLETSIQQAKGSGQPLADSIKQPMEQGFGANFSGVRIHTDARSHQLNQSIQARAFTTGQDVFFRQGEYNPSSWGGQKLLAHELTHVVQQNSSAVQRQEKEADKIGMVALHSSTKSSKQKVTNLLNQNVSLKTVQCVGENEGDLKDRLVKIFTQDDVFKKTTLNTFPIPKILIERIIKALNKEGSEENYMELIGTPEFAWAYQAAASTVSGSSGISIEKIDDRGDAATGNWTLRHYSQVESIDMIKNNLDLVANNIVDPKNSNTRSKDYAYGTPLFTFFIIAIDGKVPARGFLKSSKSYYEISLDNVNEDLWIGGDIINAKPGENRLTYRGKGKDIKKFLIKEGIKSVEDLDERFGEQFEVKYPGNVNTKAGGKWHKI